MHSRNTEKNMVLSHLTMRRALGILGFSLPVFPLFCGGSTDSYYSLCPSISAFYHSSNILIHGFFIGALVAIGVFLLCYKGHERESDEFFSDDQLASIAGIGAIGFALIPTPERCVFYRLRFLR